MFKHERLYSVLLVVLVLYALAGIPVMAGLMDLPAADRPATKLPTWSFPLLACLTGVYACAAFFVLYFRRTEPLAGRRLTRAFNIALLFAPPFGTALGLYGLWKLDRVPPPQVA